MERKGMERGEGMNMTLLHGVLPSCAGFIVFNDNFLL